MVSLGNFSVVPPTEPCALRSTQLLKVSTRDFSWAKGGRCVRLTTYHPCSDETSRKSSALTYLEPLGPPRPVAGDILLLQNVLGSVEHNRSWESKRPSVSQEISPHFLWNPEVYYRIH